jgi:hypothetical protein
MPAAIVENMVPALTSSRVMGISKITAIALPKIDFE